MSEISPSPSIRQPHAGGFAPQSSISHANTTTPNAFLKQQERERASTNQANTADINSAAATSSNIRHQSSNAASKEVSNQAQQQTQQVAATAVVVVVEQATQEQRVSDFAQHVEEANVDFKETIMKKVHTLKLKDTAELNHRVISSNTYSYVYYRWMR